jgi:hypothetical protein
MGVLGYALARGIVRNARAGDAGASRRSKCFGVATILAKSG